MFWYGCLAFLCFLLCDLNDYIGHNERLEVLFPAGAILLGLAIGNQALQGESAQPLAVRIVTGVLALGFLALLVYTVFFAVKPAGWKKPGEEAPKGQPKVVDTGVYALCRHPGVWWLFFLCLCLMPAAGFPLISLIVYTVLDILLVWYEDKTVFPKTIGGYIRYKEKTPFLFPNRESVSRCFATLKKKP